MRRGRIFFLPCSYLAHCVQNCNLVHLMHSTSCEPIAHTRRSCSNTNVITALIIQYEVDGKTLVHFLQTALPKLAACDRPVLFSPVNHNTPDLLCGLVVSFSDSLPDHLQISGMFLSDQLQWVGCQGSRVGLRGYPCSLWTLFHVLTVQAASRPDALANTGMYACTYMQRNTCVFKKHPCHSDTAHL